MSLGARFGAKSIDWLVLWSLIFLILMATAFNVVEPAQSPEAVEEVVEELAASTVFQVAQLVVAVLPGAYFVLAEGLTGRTLGKRALGLRVVGERGGPPGLAAAFRRNVWHFALLVPGQLGRLAVLGLAASIGITISTADDDRGWHDRFGETRVVRAP